MDETDPEQQGEITAKVASCVIGVSDLDRSLKFYGDVFSCRVAIREPDMALLLTPNGFQIYLHADAAFRHRELGAIGVQYLVWATDSPSELEQIEHRLRAYDPAVYSHTENAITFLEGCDPDRRRVVVAHPSPRQLPRTVIAARLRG